MSESSPKLSKSYIDKHPIRPGKQKDDLEKFGRDVLTMITRRAKNKLGESQSDGETIAALFEIKPHPKPNGGDCIEVFAAVDELDGDSSDIVVASIHIEV